MTITTQQRTRAGLVVALVAVLAAGALAGTAIGQGGSGEPAWNEALMARSDALNRYYGLGKYAGTRAKSIRRAALPAWERALIARSDALNRHYRLGKYAGK